MDEVYSKAILLLAERQGMGLLEAWEKSSRTQTFRRLLDESTGLFQQDAQVLYSAFCEELGLS